MNTLRFFVLTLALSLSVCLQARIKYVFYFIGDGMGINSIALTQRYLSVMDTPQIAPLLNMVTMPYSGIVTTHSSNRDITDSAASGTCLATGTKTNNGVVGIDPNGNNLTSILTTLHQQAWNVGLITTGGLDHATPAAFYAHCSNRNAYYQIAQQFPATGFEYAAGAGFIDPTDPSNPDNVNIYDLLEQEGYSLAYGYEHAQTMVGCDKLVMVPTEIANNRTNSHAEHPYAIDRTEKDLTLKDMVEIGINQLSAKGKFIMMIEGGSIDHTAQMNDAAGTMQEVLDLDAAVEVALLFQHQFPDETLIIVTADHETGGLSICSKNGKPDLKMLSHQHCSLAFLTDEISQLKTTEGKNLRWESVQSLLSQQLDFYTQVNISPKEDKMLKQAFQDMMKKNNTDVKTLYKSVNYLAHTAIGILNHKAHISWGTLSHSAAPVPILASGPGAERFSGWHDNTEIAPMLLQAIQ